MKAYAIKYALLLVILFVTGLFSSCDKDEKKPGNDPVKKEKVEKIQAFQEEFVYLNGFLMKVFESSEGRKPQNSTILSRIHEVVPCAEAIEEELPDGSKKISMDFGEGCENDEGEKMAGKAIIIFIFIENTSTFEYTLELIDYKEFSEEEEDEVGLTNGTASGTFLIDFENLLFTQESEQNFTLTYEDNSEASYHLIQELEETEDELHITKFELEGSLADGSEFTVNVRKTIVIDFDCESDVPVEGEEVYTLAGSTITVNYGDGACDSKYTIK